MLQKFKFTKHVILKWRSIDSKMSEHNDIKKTHLSFKIIFLNEKAQYKLYIKQKFNYILALKGSEKGDAD